MKHRRVGHTQLELSELGFGGSSIGNLYSRSTTRWPPRR